MEEKAWAINPFFASISLEFGLFLFWIIKPSWLLQFLLPVDSDQ
jgi:hypothetical protein